MSTVTKKHAKERATALRVERARRNLSQKQLAAQLGVGRGTVQRLESGASVSEEMLTLFEHALGVSL